MRRYALLLAAIRYAREKSATLCYGMSMYRAGLAPKLGVRAEFDLILSEAKLQRSGRSPRGQAFNLGSNTHELRCLKAWPHASHFVAALRST